jgi:non-ribosomal peptide synthetase component F
MPGPSLADRIEQLSAVEAFSPPAGFTAQARVRDPGDYARTAADGPAWWAEQARQRLDWQTPFSAVLDDSNPPFCTWFADGTLNVSYNCLDRHVLAGRGNRVAFHWRGEEGEERDLTYGDLLAQVQRLASGLKARGIGRGDVVGIYLPMVPEVVVAMLACAALEAEQRDHIADRIGKLARPKQIIWAEDLPKTRSGKIMRRLLRDIAEGREPGDVTTLRDAPVLDALQYATSPGGTGT